MDTVFRNQIRRVRDDGATVLLSSHILSEVEQLCDRVTIIRSGRAVEPGTLTELRHLKRTHFRIQGGADPVRLAAIPGPCGGSRRQGRTPAGRPEVAGALARREPRPGRRLGDCCGRRRRDRSRRRASPLRHRQPSGGAVDRCRTGACPGSRGVPLGNGRDLCGGAPPLHPPGLEPAGRRPDPGPVRGTAAAAVLGPGSEPVPPLRGDAGGTVRPGGGPGPDRRRAAGGRDCRVPDPAA